MAHSYDFLVDTVPMAKSVDGVTGHIQGTTAAVVAMQAAVIASEQRAAQQISSYIDSGFYNLINSQISMKLAAQYTQMNAKLSLLLNYSKALMRSKERMENDFSRLRREYLKIFSSLDRALENRIKQLDRDATRISDYRSKVIFGRLTRDVPETSVVSNEISAAELQLVVARLKDKTARSLSSLGNKVHEGETFNAQMDDLMNVEKVEESELQYIPVAYTNEQSMVREDSYVTKFTFPEYLSADVKNRMEMEIFGRMSEFDKPKNGREKKLVSDEFHNMVSTSGLDPRVAELMTRLFDQGDC